MALLHREKNSSSSPAAKTEAPRGFPLEVWVLFSNLVCTCVALPALSAPVSSPWTIGWTVLATGCVGLSHRMLRGGLEHGFPAHFARPRIAGTRGLVGRSGLPVPWPVLLSLAGAPTCLAAAMIPLTARIAGPWDGLLSTLALWAYAAVVLRTLQQRTTPSPGTVTPYDRAPPTSANELRTRVIAAFYAVGALAIGVIAPGFYVEGAPSAPWQALQALVAIALSVVVSGLYLARALRRRTDKPAPIPISRVLVVATGLVTYAVLLRLSAP